MLKADDRVFLEIPDEYTLASDARDQYVLYPGRALEVEGDTYSVEFETVFPAVEAEQEILIYYDERLKFMRQNARVTTVDKQEAVTIHMERVGDPAVVERRTCFRVSTVAAEISASFGDDENCEVLDVSATGFSLYADGPYKVGQRVETVLHFDGEEYRDTVVIQSARKAGKRTRYGVGLTDEAGSPGAFRQALPRINLAIQRQQMARLSGA